LAGPVAHYHGDLHSGYEAASPIALPQGSVESLKI